jgi:hypothetical protein
LEGSISPLFVSSTRSLAVAAKLLTARPRRTKIDEPRMEKDLDSVCRLPSYHQVSCAFSIGCSCLASRLLTSLGISWTNGFTSTSFNPTFACWTPSSISLNRTLDGRERAAGRQGSPGRVCLASSRVACRLRHGGEHEQRTLRSASAVLSCNSLRETCRRRLAINDVAWTLLWPHVVQCKDLHLSDKPTKATLVHAIAPQAKAAAR